MKNKLNIKKIINILSIGIIGSAFVISTGFAITFIIKKNNNNLTQTALGKDNIKTISLNKSKDVPVTLIEHETGGFFFFGEDGLKALNERIKSELQFGPEIEDLKFIRINNKSILEKDVEGQYQPFTQELEISISKYLNWFKDIPIEQKIDLIFPTVVHEYGHHFSNTYITSIATNDPRNSKKLFSKRKFRNIHKNIPKEFLRVFEDSLHYSNTLENNLLSSDASSVSSFTTARELYNLSNGKDDIYSLDLNNKNFKTIIPYKNSNLDIAISSERYSYLFSIDELLTRKLQQITYVDNLNGKSIANGKVVFTGSEVRNGLIYISTIAGDISKNKKITLDKGDTYKINDELILMDYPYGGTFNTKDGEIYKIPSTAQDLWNAYFDIGGYDLGISQIYMKNDSTQVVKIINGNQVKSRKTLSPDNFYNIKFSGFLDSKKKYKSLILKDKSNKNVKADFIKNNYEYKWMNAKSDILSPKRDLVKEQTKFGYTTEYISIKNIDLKQPIKAWNDINDDNIINVGEEESLTISNNRPTSTFRESFSSVYENGEIEHQDDVKGRPFYEIDLRDNDAYLTEYTFLNNQKNILNFNKSSMVIDAFIPDDIIVLYTNQNKRKW